jgi:helix-turn-helix protein
VNDRVATVVWGTWYIGYGDYFDKARLKALPAGSFYHQKATGLSPTEYIQHLRVGKARESLEFSSQAMKEIAWKVGYEDYGAFRKVFQKIMGLSPADYRLRFSVQRK